MNETTPPNGSLTAIEQRGIEPVPADQRTGNPFQLFWVWFAANISILGIPLGATLVVLGLNVWQALLAAVIGSVGSFAIVGIVSVAGRRGGAPSMTLSRAVFGVRGNAAPTFVTLISRLGWETVNTTTGAFVLLSLFSIFTGSAIAAKEAPLLTLLGIGIFVLCTLLVSGLGHAAILVIQRWATWIFGALNLVVGGFLIVNVDWQTVGAMPAGPLSAVILGIATIAAGTGIGWAAAGADMARYQRTSVKAAHLIASSAAGAGIPLILLIGLGSLLTASDDSLASATDPVAAIRELLPPEMAAPYLIAAFGGLLLSNHLSVYSAGLTTITLGLRVRRVYAVTVDVIVTFLGAIYFMLIADSFYDPFIAFISLLAIPLTAWLGVFLADMVHRRHYQAAGLLDMTASSRYWYRGGFEWRALLAWAVAIAAGYGTRAADQAGIAWLVTFAAAFGLYLLMGGAPARDRADTAAPTVQRSGR
ncbi:purine-cytosine permease family protein [Sediminivirga luteola]|jgi:purine-cytosine permease-like protein|uniref:Allantoin permease n=1 Tax=Sediminivirga luteola TaxID=1774748 RepID=A0A8J2TVH1_9MICO|nr:cytosine permease [Sediminivirga luteola]MCI2265950.1 cytosine permease [Sediminivirga luteola]GGA03608.1 allantoin permease [Sediminivirga luteola]